MCKYCRIQPPTSKIPSMHGKRHVGSAWQDESLQKQYAEAQVHREVCKVEQDELELDKYTEEDGQIGMVNINFN